MSIDSVSREATAEQQETLRLLILPEEQLDFSGYMHFLNSQDDVEVYIIDDVKEAFDRVTHKQVDAIVSGLQLAGDANGLEFLTDVRRYDLVMPFFFLSNNSSQQLVASAFQAGANDYFVADRTEGQMKLIIDAVKVSAEIASMLRERSPAEAKPSLFAKKYEVVFDELREGTMMLNASTGEITFVNDILAEATGRQADNLLGKEINNFLTPHKEALDDWRYIAAAAETPGSSEHSIIQLCFRHTNGSSKMFWTHVMRMEIKGRDVLLCRCRDVTRFEKLEHEIAAIRNQLKVIVENSADAIILCRDDGTVEFIGGAGPRMFGISPEDMSIASLEDLFGNTSSELRKVLRTMGNRNRVTGIENSIYSRWGSQIPVHIAITRLPSSDAITRYLLNVMDITQQKVMEAERHLVSDLINLMGGGKPASKTLPQLVQKLKTRMMISFGLVVAVPSNRSDYQVVAVENTIGESALRSGQRLEADFLPVEEELWLNEGIIRNNLQEYGLYPLESLLYQEGVRSYISLPLMREDRLVGAVHFGSSNAYAVNRGHLTLFKQIASALAGTALQSATQEAMDTTSTLLALAMGATSELRMMIEGNGTILAANEPAQGFFGDDISLPGRQVHLALSERFLGVPGPGELLAASADKPMTINDDAGQGWLFSAHRSSDDEQGHVMVVLTRN